MATEQSVKNQHYVWRHYLAAWASTGAFWCYRQRDQQLFSTQPKSVANENYFYEVLELSAGDRLVLESVIGKASDQQLREINRHYIELTQTTFQLRKALENRGLPSNERAAIEDELRWAEKNLVERYHGNVENGAVDLLDALRGGDDAFYADDERSIDFVYFLAHQYFRTANMRRRLAGIPTHIPGHDPVRTAPILTHLFARSLGAALYRERDAFKLRFLNNRTAIPFIAGDQPVLNLLDPNAHTDVELFYPLSPTLALLVTKDVNRYPRRDCDLAKAEIEHYNRALYAESYDQLYASRGDYLRELVASGKPPVVKR